MTEPTEMALSGDRSYTNSYVVPASIDVAWRAFTDPPERALWWGFPMDPLEHADEVDPPRFYRQRQDHPGLPGPTEMSVTFEAMGDETRITHTHGGLGDGLVWDGVLQSGSNGIDELMADLTLYLQTGVGLPRHTSLRTFDLLQGTREHAGALEVFDVPEGSFAAEVGLQPGDLVVGLGGAAVFGFREVCFALRERSPGDTIEVTWVRDGEIRSGRGELHGPPFTM